MSEIGEAVGEAVQGGLYARTVEPTTGEDGRTREGACLNCGIELTGLYCHDCGQKAHVHRTLGAFLHDLVHGALHFEGKTWRTLPLLVLRPGALTRRYIAGERARFVSPIALFLFSVFLMFAVFQMAGIGPPTGIASTAQVEVDPSIEEQLQSLRGSRPEREGPQAVLIDRQIGELERRIDQAAVNGNGRVVLAETPGGGGALSFRPTGWAFLDRTVDKWRENPGLMAYKLQTNFYKFSWLLIPLSVPFVWLILAWRRGVGAYDHAVFVTYSLSFMTLLMIALTLLGTVGASGNWLLLAFVLVAPAHIYKQLRGAYSLSRFSAGWRLAVLLLFIATILAMFLNLLLLLGALG